MTANVNVILDLPSYRSYFPFGPLRSAKTFCKNQDKSFGLDRTFLTNIMIMDNTSLPIDYPGEGANVNGH